MNEPGRCFFHEPAPPPKPSAPAPEAAEDDDALPSKEALDLAKGLADYCELPKSRRGDAAERIDKALSAATAENARLREELTKVLGAPSAGEAYILVMKRHDAQEAEIVSLRAKLTEAERYNRDADALVDRVRSERDAAEVRAKEAERELREQERRADAFEDELSDMRVARDHAYARENEQRERADAAEAEKKADLESHPRVLGRSRGQLAASLDEALRQRDAAEARAKEAERERDERCRERDYAQSVTIPALERRIGEAVAEERKRCAQVFRDLADADRDIFGANHTARESVFRRIEKALLTPPGEKGAEG